MKKAQEIRKEIIQTEFKKHMLQAAQEVIIRRGFKAATMDEIAREAGFCKATLYKYFKNKGEILLEIILQYIEDVKNRILEVSSSDDPPEEKLKKMIYSLLEIQLKKSNISRLFIQDKNIREFLHRFFGPSDKENNREVQQAIKNFNARREEIFKAGLEVIKEGIDKGVFIKGSPERILYYVWAVTEGLMHVRFWQEKKLSPEKESEEIFAFLMKGIGQSPTPKGEKK
ncbi:MAG: TetR/AcrR family transcriptional regulator [Candidatus Aminicenantes bacterium]|nr:TetR/AcrR family transcriptional regulator [Candidatus Aminicenantes bacterium]